MVENTHFLLSGNLFITILFNIIPALLVLELTLDIKNSCTSGNRIVYLYTRKVGIAPKSACGMWPERLNRICAIHTKVFMRLSKAKKHIIKFCYSFFPFMPPSSTSLPRMFVSKFTLYIYKYWVRILVLYPSLGTQCGVLERVTH